MNKKIGVFDVIAIIVSEVSRNLQYGIIVVVTSHIAEFFRIDSINE